MAYTSEIVDKAYNLGGRTAEMAVARWEAVSLPVRGELAGVAAEYQGRTGRPHGWRVLEDGKPVLWSNQGE